MDIFNYITTQAPRTALDHIILSRDKFLELIQGGKTINDLFFGIEKKQEKLVRVISDCVICLSFLFSNNIYKSKFLLRDSNTEIKVSNISSVIKLMENGVIVSSSLFSDLKQLINYVNNLCSEFFKIYENGEKI